MTKRRTSQQGRRSLRTDVLVVLRLLELARYWPEDSEARRLEALYPRHAKIARRCEPLLFEHDAREPIVLDGTRCRSCQTSLVPIGCRSCRSDHSPEECAEEHLVSCSGCRRSTCPHCRHGCTCIGQAPSFLARVRGQAAYLLRTAS